MQFIATYEGALPPTVCSKIIAAAEAGPGGQGEIGVGLLPSVKKSVDYWLEELPLEGMPQALSDNLWTHVTMYARSHPHLVTGTLPPALPTGELVTSDVLQKVPFRVVTRICKGIFAIGQFNVQRYQRDAGGFFHWHSEIAPSPTGTAALHRILFAIYYLNDVEVGGETEFAAQGHRVSPRTGRLLLAPAGFTHTHRGQTPKSSDKWIITTWVSFRQASELHLHNPAAGTTTSPSDET